MKQQKITLKSGDLSLEGILYLPEGNGPFPGVVVCHLDPALRR
jgi:dienelactone hydrolase